MSQWLKRYRAKGIEALRPKGYPKSPHVFQNHKKPSLPPCFPKKLKILVMSAGYGPRPANAEIRKPAGLVDIINDYVPGKKTGALGPGKEKNSSKPKSARLRPSSGPCRLMA